MAPDTVAITGVTVLDARGEDSVCGEPPRRAGEGLSGKPNLTPRGRNDAPTSACSRRGPSPGQWRRCWAVRKEPGTAPRRLPRSARAGRDSVRPTPPMKPPECPSGAARGHQVTAGRSTQGSIAGEKPYRAQDLPEGPLKSSVSQRRRQASSPDRSSSSKPRNDLVWIFRDSNGR